MDQQLHLASQTSFTCISCGSLSFADSAQQKEHFRSELHRFNLKRKCAGLPPITQAVFDEVVVTEEQKQREAEEAFAKSAPYHCSVCLKKFKTLKAYATHINSRRHRVLAQEAGVDPIRPNGDDGVLEQIAAADQSGEGPAEGEDPEEAIRRILESRRRIADDECPFCSWRAPEELAAREDEGQAAFDAMLAHAREHGFFVPSECRCVDQRALMRYAADKVSLGLRCLWCRTSSFNSLEAVQAHMRALCHCKILLETEDDADEWADFYEEPSEDDRCDARVSENGLELLLRGGRRVAGHRSLLSVYRQAVRLPIQYRPGGAARAVIEGSLARGLITDGREKAPGSVAGRDARWERTLAEERRAALRHLQIGLTGNTHYNRQQTNV
eukprot:m51a1_g14264 hypothetical protein (385) ;mRNA; f:301774-303268